MNIQDGEKKFKKKVCEFIAAIIILLSACCSNASKSEFSNSAFLLYNANIIDVENGITTINMALLIDDGHIKRIGEYKALKSLVPKESHFNLEQRFIIPGLWDMHSHIDKLSEDIEHSKSMLSLYTLSGVTSIREMGGDWDIIKRLRGISKSSHYLPTIYTAGPILENKAFVDWVAEIDNDPEFKRQRVGISSKEEVGSKVDSVLKLGVDFIKIRTAASAEVFFEVAQQCKKNNIKLCGHIDAKVDLYDAVKAGISSLEHLDIFQLSGMSDSKMDSVANLMKEYGTAYCPTLIYFKKHRIYDKEKIDSFLNDTTYTLPLRSYVSQRLLVKSKKAMESAGESQVPWKEMETNFLKFANKLVDNNVLVLAGTDGANALVLPGFGLYEEFELYSTELQMSPLEILQTATINPSIYFGFENRLGLVREGYVADLVILDKNPLLSIDNIRTVNSVIKSGAMISNDDVKERLDSIRKSNRRR